MRNPNRIRKTAEDHVINTACVVFGVLLALACIYPIYYTLINSLNEGADAARGGIYLWPRVFSLHNYAVVFKDDDLPMSFLVTVLRTLRERGSRIPVLLLTAKSEVEDKVRGLDMGANDYLTKPFATAELLARIRAMTRSQSAQLSSRLTFGNVCLDQTTFELSAPGGSYRLAKKEYQMLELLMQNPGQVIPTERFLERIWGYDSDVDVGVVWVYVSYLRKKLAALNADIQIRATRNTGYSLEVRP